VATELAPGDTTVLDVAGEEDDVGLSIPATVTSSTRDENLENNTAIIAGGDVCRCASTRAGDGDAPIASLVLLCGAGFVISRRRRCRA
jgi:hypothetical protein